MAKEAIGWIDAEGKAHKIQFQEMADGSYRVTHQKEAEDHSGWRKLNEMYSASAPKHLKSQRMRPSHLKDQESLI